MADFGAIADKLIEAHRPRAKSLIVTMIGDALVPHGGVAWMASFIALGRLFGLNERLVRTSVQRLVADNWLVSEAHGRKAAYRVTDAGRHRVRESEQRIFAETLPEWDGEWRLLFTGFGDCGAATRERLRKELLWLGFGQVAPGVFARPSARYDEVAPILRQLGVEDAVAPLRGRSLPGLEEANRVLARAWNFDALAGDYEAFLSGFGPLETVLESGPPPVGETAYRLRTILIHEFRRVVLRDPMLPAALMAEDWVGNRARELCARIYGRLAEPSIAYLTEAVSRPEGPLPPAAETFFGRFGGLDRRARQLAATPA